MLRICNRIVCQTICQTAAWVFASQLGGLHMRVDSATGPGSGTASAGSYNKSRSIFVGNLHFAAQVCHSLRSAAAQYQNMRKRLLAVESRVPSL